MVWVLKIVFLLGKCFLLKVFWWKQSENNNGYCISKNKPKKAVEHHRTDTVISCIQPKRICSGTSAVSWLILPIPSMGLVYG